LSRKRFGMPFSRRMRDHDDGDSRAEKGDVSSAACAGLQTALQLLGLYDARRARIYVQIGETKKRNWERRVESSSDSFLFACA